MNMTCTACQALSSGADGSAFHCGFCKTLNGKACVNGTIDGPLGVAGNCPGSWLYDTCTGVTSYHCVTTVLSLSLTVICKIDADRCADITNCSQCVANSECGWCDGTCMSGTSTGPGVLIFQVLFVTTITDTSSKTLPLPDVLSGSLLVPTLAAYVVFLIRLIFLFVFN